MQYLFENVEQEHVVKTKFVVIEADSEAEAVKKLHVYGRACGVDATTPLIQTPTTDAVYTKISEHHPEVDLDFFVVDENDLSTD